MRVRSFVVYAVFFSAAMAAMAQTAATPTATQPSAVTQPAAQPIDPIYTTPAASLTAKQVEQLQRLGADWPQLARYREDNATLTAPAAGEQRVVFYGDSITDGWGRRVTAPFFPGKPYVNRGISGQTTAQMVVRFRQDVIALRPAVVVILAGTNDIAGNTGLSSVAMIEDNFASMSDLARVHGIRVVLASVLPVSNYPWRPGTHPADTVREVNAWLKSYAQANGLVYLDYYSAMTNSEGGLDKTLASDGVHPTVEGYARMAPLAEKAIAQALSAPAATAIPVIR